MQVVAAFRIAALHVAHLASLRVYSVVALNTIVRKTMCHFIFNYNFCISLSILYFYMLEISG